MELDTNSRPVETYYAPAERASETEVAAAREAFLAEPLAVALFEALPDPAVVLNRQRQIIAANSAIRRLLGVEKIGEVLSIRPGEAVGCMHAGGGPGGCGTGPFCIDCGAVRSIVECLESRAPVSEECRVRTCLDVDGGALDLAVQAIFMQVQDRDLVILCLRDISAEKRRRVLERVFFHDVLNTALEIHAVSRLMHSDQLDDESRARYRQDLEQLSRQIMDELAAQRQLLEAEHGDLEPQMGEVSAVEVLESVLKMYGNHNSAEGRELSLGEVPPVSLRTDPTLLRRVLGNLVKNALEAIGEGERVALAAEDRGDEVAFTVRNPGAMSEPVQRQIFHRSFTTKGGTGRGVGTHSAKLFAERYLGGVLSFGSSETEGTIFTVVLPKQGPG